MVVGASATAADAARGLARVRGSLPGVRSGYAVSAEMVSPWSGRGFQAEVAVGGGPSRRPGLLGSWVPSLGADGRRCAVGFGVKRLRVPG